MQYKFLAALITALILIGTVSGSYAGGWLIYHKPEFKGKVIDAETKEPIEGAVVVAVYYKKSMMGIVESYSVIVNVKETLTDKNGEFYIPSYTTVIQPLSWESYATFIIYKPGYGSFPDWRIHPPKKVMRISVGAESMKGRRISFEEFFSGELGVVKEVWVKEPWKINAVAEKGKVTFGLVELPKLKTKKERLRAIPGTPADYRSKELPLLYKLKNEERKKFGLGEVK